MKYYYAKVNGNCYKFKSKPARDAAVAKFNYTPLTATEAMREFGYTDDASRRVIRAEECICEAELLAYDIFKNPTCEEFIKYKLDAWQEEKQKYAVIFEGCDTSKWLYLFWWNGKELETYSPGDLNEAQQLIDYYHFSGNRTRVYLRESREDVTRQLRFNPAYRDTFELQGGVK